MSLRDKLAFNFNILIFFIVTQAVIYGLSIIAIAMTLGELEGHSSTASFYK